MIHHTRLSLQGAALLAVLALPGTLRAQDATRPAPAPEATPVRQAAPAQTDPAAARRAAAARADEAADRGPVRREVMSKLRDEEIRHRERLATIHRLRQIAESQGQAERLALLDKLEVKEGARYNAATQVTAVRLGNTAAYKQTLIKLADGRIRRNAPAEEPAQPKRTLEERKARQEQKAAERAANKPARKAPAERPKAEAPKTDAPKAQRQQQANATRTEAARTAQPARRAATAPAPARRTTEARKPASRGGSGSSSSGTRSPRSDS